MKKWNLQKILNAILLVIGAIGGGAYGLETAGVIDLNPAPVQAEAEPIAAVPGAPVYYIVNAQVIWKKTNTALPDDKYFAVMHQVRMEKIPTLGSAFNVVRDGFVNGKIKEPAPGYVPVYLYSAEVVTRVGIPLSESGDKPKSEKPVTE
jgi:hypothetical protein